ncbi:MAG: NYN domain-containing protein [Phycisphaerales bacterium]|nr:MAG: NYN domain-containing protein [Phycisphaerales bacterium]
MFIIDGHNLLHSIRKADEKFEPVSDVQLCRSVGMYLKLIGENGEIVFDGTGPPDKRGFAATGNVEVLFAGGGSDTDTVIEDKIAVSTAPKSLSIVSSDRRLRRAALRRRATAIKSEDFWRDVQKQLSRKRRAKEPPAKQHGLTESETDRWLEHFGLQQ